MNGILVVDKPQGLTSFDVVARVRRALRVKKCGHTGTLDPMATGVLPVMLGSATKLAPYLVDSRKEYTARMLLGRSTDTLDITGLTTEEADLADHQLKESDILEAMRGFTGDILQEPPMFSALKKDGKRLYELARQGIEVEREKRPVTIYALELVSYDFPYIEFHAAVSKGTYIRSLIRDLGAALGVPATMAALQRTLTGGFTLDDAVSLEELDSVGIIDKIIQVESTLTEYPELPLDDSFINLLKNGVRLKDRRATGELKEGIYRIKDQTGRFIGLGEFKDAELVLNWRL